MVAVGTMVILVPDEVDEVGVTVVTVVIVDD